MVHAMGWSVEQQIAGVGGERWFWAITFLEASECASACPVCGPEPEGHLNEAGSLHYPSLPKPTNDWGAVAATKQSSSPSLPSRPALWGHTRGGSCETTCEPVSESRETTCEHGLLSRCLIRHTFSLDLLFSIAWLWRAFLLL